MPINTKLDQAFSFQEAALRLRAERQTLLAANIANADTPNYKARDFDFNVALKSAVQVKDLLNNSANLGANGQGLGLAQGHSSLGNLSHALSKNLNASKTNAQHMQPTNTDGASLAAGEVKYRGIIQGSVDGNTVDMDMERNLFADNALRYEASVNMINGQIKKMLTAIQGQ